MNVSGTSYSKKLLLATSRFMASKYISLMASFTSILVMTRRLSVESLLLLSLIAFKPYSYSVNSILVQLHCLLNSMAKHMNTELVSQFTEDAYTIVDQICEHSSCGIQIRAGKPCLYIATLNPEQIQKYKSNIKKTEIYYIFLSHDSCSSYNLAISECCAKKIMLTLYIIANAELVYSPCIRVVPPQSIPI
ncbi:hypothetical protein P692DRAFT_201809143 [Suillus brevipes Sb2]|nr:hypothetical protein P692DRAFT_201809143 [Suillus brevipes Sb2]